MLTFIISLIAIITITGCIATIPPKQHYYKCAFKGNESNYWLIVARNATQAKAMFAKAVGNTDIHSITIVNN